MELVHRHSIGVKKCILQPQVRMIRILKNFNVEDILSSFCVSIDEMICSLPI